MGLYAATKAFVLSFSEALWAETKDYDVRVLGLCPGPTRTEFFKVADFPSAVAPKPAASTTPAQVVADAIAAVEANQPNCVTGGLANQLLVNSGRFFPRGWLASSVKAVFKPSKGAK